jgi:hypothetical protein
MLSNADSKILLRVYARVYLAEVVGRVKVEEQLSEGFCDSYGPDLLFRPPSFSAPERNIRSAFRRLVGTLLDSNNYSSDSVGFLQIYEILSRI